MNALSIDQAISHLPANKVQQLASEVTGLDAAMQCITAGASADQVRGRIDDLINERRAQLRAMYSSALSELVHSHG